MIDVQYDKNNPDRIDWKLTHEVFLFDWFMRQRVRETAEHLEYQIQDTLF